MSLFNSLYLYTSSFYSQLNDIGKLVFIIIILLVLILIILIIIMFAQKASTNKYIKALKSDEEKIINNKLDNVEVDETNEKTRDLKKIVEALNNINTTPVDKVEVYENEQEQEAVISYKELIEQTETKEVKSSINTEIPKTYTKETESKIVDESETFLKSLKEFRSNL